MKTFSRVLMVLMVVLCVVAAQAHSSVILKGNVPFNFIVGDRNLPSGQYTISAATQNIESWYDANGRGLFMINTVPMGKEASADTYKLVFHRYGDTYILTEVWSGGSSHLVNGGRTAQQIAKNQKFEVVAVLMTR